jgi:peptidylprolyl isomerase
LLFNVKVFYLFFIVVMIASLGAVGLAPNSSGNRTPPPIDDPIDLEPTPSGVLAFDAPARTIDGAEPHVAIIKTTKGDIRIELATDAPRAVNSFAFLAGKGFYDGTTFFYVDHDFVAQAGDPTCKVGSEAACSGVGGPGYSLPIEQTRDGHVQWAVVAPIVGEGENAVHGSQFRVLYQPDSRLDGKETVFGKIVDTESQKILESLSNLAPCSAVVNTVGCDPDLSTALVIQEVIVQPA